MVRKVAVKNAGSDAESDLYAVLDLGSNSFHLLIGRLDQGRIVTVDRRKDMVRLAQGLDEDKNLTPEAMQRATESLTLFAQRLRKIRRERIKVVGTNTLRAAHNGDQFLEVAEKLIGVPVDIISGHEEGRLIFLGVVKGHSGHRQHRLVMDIGGGSTEFMVGRKKAKRIESLFMGCVSYSQRFFPDQRVNRQCYQKALNAARAELRPLKDGFGPSHWDEVVGTSGTIRHVEAAIDKLTPCGHIITRAGIEALVKKYFNGNALRSVPASIGVSEERLPVFAGGLSILHAAFIELDISEMHVSDYALKEGVLYELADHDEFEDTRRRTIEYLSRQFGIDRKQARRVERLALQLLPQVQKQLGTDVAFAKQLLSDAARLHELGLTIAHSGYHKHGAYILENADMPGFSRQEQKMLSFLVLNHRRKLRMPTVQGYRFEADWVLVLVLRLAWLLQRSRTEQRLPKIGLQYMPRSKHWRLTIPQSWLRRHPLVVEDLSAEAAFLKAVNLSLVIAGD